VPAKQDDQQPPPPQLPRASTNPAVAVSATAPYIPLTGSEKWHYYLRSTYGPLAIGRAVFGAAINQAQDSNPEWGQGAEGYGKRLASKFGQHVIKRSVTQGLGSLLHEDPRYFASTSSGFLPRLKHAATWEVVTRKDDGSYKIADARLIGTFTGAFVSRAWHPEGERNFTSGLESGAISLAIDAGWNVVKEFWPDVRRHFRH
jgi:hypothetical protein